MQKPILNNIQKEKAINIIGHRKLKNVINNAASVKGKILAEGLTLESPWGDIEKCLRSTVAPNFCIAMAYVLKYTNYIQGV